MRYLGTSREFHSSLETDDLPTNEEVIAEADAPEFLELVGNQREKRLFAEIGEVQGRLGDTASVAAVAWGAGHIGAVTEHLSKRWGYFPRSAEWVTVFDYTK